MGKIIDRVRRRDEARMMAVARDLPLGLYRLHWRSGDGYIGWRLKSLALKAPSNG